MRYLEAKKVVAGAGVTSSQQSNRARLWCLCTVHWGRSRGSGFRIGKERALNGCKDYFAVEAIDDELVSEFSMHNPSGGCNRRFMLVLGGFRVQGSFPEIERFQH